jgi:multidrug efflux pump
MTSFAFILGVVPLVLATGAGAEMRRTLGIAVFSGMLGVTAFGIFFTPVFYSVIRKFTEQKPASAAPSAHDKARTVALTNGEADVAAADGHAAKPAVTPQPVH